VKSYDAAHYLPRLSDMNNHPAEASITELNASQLSEAIHSRRLSCQEVMRAYLDHIRNLNGTINAIVSLRPEEDLMLAAKEADDSLEKGHSKGWMHGMPQAIKDLSNVKGIPTSLGSPLMRGTMPSEDGLMASRMRAAGAVFVGKTNTPEFGLGSHTFNEVFGATRNPWDPSKTAGGSSGGAAAALATRMLPVADGSDFMGSLRNPAGWCNVVGFRPSQGRVPMWPANDSFISQLGTEGPMGRTVEDVSRLLQIQSGFSAKAPLSLGEPYRHADWEALPGGLSGIRIGWLGDLGGHLAMETGVLSTVEAALLRCQAGGAQVEAAALGMEPELVWQAWLVWRRALVAGRIASYLEKPENRSQIKPEALWEFDQAAALKGTELLAASARRTAFYQAICQELERFDVLALPSAQVWPFDLTQRWPQSIGGRSMDTYHRWMEVTIYATFAGLPAVCMPAGFNDQGLPIGIQLIGRPRADAQVLQVAHAYEGLIQDWMGMQPP
jgi:amidase